MCGPQTWTRTYCCAVVVGLLKLDATEFRAPAIPTQVLDGTVRSSAKAGPGHMLQYVRSEISIFGHFRTHILGQISYAIGSDLAQISSRIRTHHGSDIATDGHLPSL